MNEHPILFRGDMVRAILDGRKTQTRRPITNPRWAELGTMEQDGDDMIAIANVSGCFATVKCPFGESGHDLWVREAWCHENIDCDGVDCEQPTHIYHRATESYPESLKWKPSIHMPRWASRLSLKVIDVRIEFILDITGRGAWMEGSGKPCVACGYTLQDSDEQMDHHLCKGPGWTNARNEFLESWDKTYASRGLGTKDNPFVWVVDFEKKMSL